MKKTFTFLFIIFSSILFSQNFQSDFNNYFQKNDTLNLKITLEKWEKENPKDSELYTSYFNYYFQKSKKEVLSLSKKQPNGESLILKDSVNQTAGYLGSEVLYNDIDIQNAFNRIDKGIKLFPNRLDMRFGKIYALGVIEDWKNFTIEIIKTIKYSNINKNQWTWTNNIKKENGKDFLLSSLQNYQVQLYNTEQDELLVNMQNIALEILKLYPENVESYSNLSITYFLTNQFEKGIVELKKAEKINPKDYIVLSNIAHGYKLIGNNENAIEYYEKAIKYGDDYTIDFAKKEIAKLKK